jgi:hypothetical protein
MNVRLIQDPPGLVPPWAAAGLALVCFTLTSCGEPGAQDGGPTASAAPDAASGALEGRSGTLAFELKTAGDVTLSGFDYTITGPKFAKTGSVDVSKSNTLSARIDGLPAADGYSITVLGSSVGEPVAKCSGSAGFDILARSVTNVPINVSCRVERSETSPVVAAPLPRYSTWLYGLLLLGVGAALAKRARSRSG